MTDPGTTRAVVAVVRRRSGPLAVGLSALLAVVYLLWQPQTLDLAAQQFRGDLWEREGWVLWSPFWYGGHSIPGYSLIYPPVGAWLGPALVGALSAIAATALFASIALRAYGERAWLGVIWFGLASAVAPFGGRTTFALGLAVGLLCLWAVQRERRVLASMAGLATPLASPVAGLFVVVACAGVVAGRRSPERLLGHAEGPISNALAGATAATAGLLVLALAFPIDGFQPFAFSAWIWIPLSVGALLLLTRVDDAVLRWGALIYLAVATVALLAETPLGGNVVRLGLTLAGPLLAIVLIARRRPALLGLLAVPLLWWQWTATVRDVAAAQGDPATEAAYYAPLVTELEQRAAGRPIRIQIPPTRNRWEARYVAPVVPLARGWLRQLETEDIALFDGDQLDARGYRAWLAERGVSYVALSDAEPDYIADREVELLEDGVPGLEQVWENEHWRLFSVADREPTEALVAGDAEILAASADRLEIELREPRVSVAFAGARFFGVVSDSGCSTDPDPELGEGWLRIEAPDASPATPVVVELGAGTSFDCR